MPLLLTQSDASLMRVTDIAMSAGAAARMRIDAQGWAAGTESFSLVIPCVIDEPSPFDGERVILEFTRGENFTFALTCRDNGTGARTMRWHIAGQTPLEVAAPPLTSRVVAAAFTYERHPSDASASVVSLWVVSSDMQVAGSASRTLGAMPLVLAPTGLGLGHQHLGLTGTQTNLRGLALLFALRAVLMDGRLIGDGRPTTLGTPTADLRSLIFPVGSDG
ncbi:MAG: hypothetical protein NTV94_11995, partial [Planctomycetota bacterium]|nr:hypothetical protein [Planctomycetota bacterium]